MELYCKDNKITQSTTMPYRPQTNGKVERFNGILKTIFYAVSSANISRSPQWILDQALNIYNRRPNSTGYSPIFLALGVIPEDPTEEYQRESTLEEEAAFAAEIVNIYSPKV